mmetsp:Transcript_20323/g.59370  ORF Transcript_20323/g.59370 Transcript_20323/m.59370 type:complete len:295 (-) Transcript_20323:61-945(-)
MASEEFKRRPRDEDGEGVQRKRFREDSRDYGRRPDRVDGPRGDRGWRRGDALDGGGPKRGAFGDRDRWQRGGDPGDRPENDKEPRGRAPPEIPPTPPVDRDKVCPLLLRCFWSLDGHRRDGAYSKADLDELPSNEVQIHTWPDATLREIVDLLKNVNNPGGMAARRRVAKLSFAFVYPDRNGRFNVRQVGRVFSVPGDRKDDGDRTLASLRFQTGDFLDVAIFVNGPGAGGPGGRGGGPGGRNAGGFGPRGTGDRGNWPRGGGDGFRSRGGDWDGGGGRGRGRGPPPRESRGGL